MPLDLFGNDTPYRSRRSTNARKLARRNKHAAAKVQWREIYERAPIISCACGCGQQIKAIDEYGRPRKFISGHNGRKYADPGQHKREWNHRHRPQRYAAKKRFHRTRKVRLILHFGGKCVTPECGILYNGQNAAIFHFHHRDPKSKKFAIGNQVVNKKWEALLLEAEKCDMICANCHELKHGELF